MREWVKNRNGLLNKPFIQIKFDKNFKVNSVVLCGNKCDARDYLPEHVDKGHKRCAVSKDSQLIKAAQGFFDGTVLCKELERAVEIVRKNEEIKIPEIDAITGVKFIKELGDKIGDAKVLTVSIMEEIIEMIENQNDISDDDCITLFKKFVEEAGISFDEEVEIKSLAAKIMP